MSDFIVDFRRAEIYEIYNTKRLVDPMGFPRKTSQTLNIKQLANLTTNIKHYVQKHLTLNPIQTLVSVWDTFEDIYGIARKVDHRATYFLDEGALARGKRVKRHAIWDFFGEFQKTYLGNFTSGDTFLTEGVY